ncbi:unnamed protein product [Triticum turgidum subsp. durum]|uniref:DUF3615 domain-containing protein n=1 Tax=Triticum turgidum subsp. durum TaxID=4567 RepID=A0A9R0ZTP2_TRITD|nr:unnamed protein product [Triticum turgidum subsp. durum]
MSSANATSCVYGEIWIDGFARLHKGGDFTSSPSSNTLQEFGDVWLAAAQRQLSLRPKSPSPEELTKRRQERKRKGLVIALDTYAKRNNMQLTDLEFVEEKERNQVYGRGALYVHSNFLVKGSDGKPTMFFAEMHPDCTQEEDVVCCTPLEENDYGHCVECDDRANELRHPSGGGYLGGHDEMIFHFEELDSDDDCFM